MDRPWQLDGILRALWNAQVIAKYKADKASSEGHSEDAAVWCNVVSALHSAAGLTHFAQREGRHTS